MRNRVTLWLAASILLWIGVAVAATADVRVRDGDTIVVSEHPVRLRALDCPEADTPKGVMATALMKQLVYGTVVVCGDSFGNSYDRTVRYCSADAVDLGELMIASGLCTSEPVPVVMTRGSNPKAVVIVVIKTGLNFEEQPAITDSRRAFPCALKCSNREIRTRPSVRAIPNRAINPIDDGMLRFSLNSASAKTPPTNDRGMLSMISSTFLSELNKL